MTAQNTTGQDWAGQGKTGLGWAGLGWTALDRILMGQDRAERAGQGRAVTDLVDIRSPHEGGKEGVSVTEVVLRNGGRFSHKPISPVDQISLACTLNHERHALTDGKEARQQVQVYILKPWLYRACLPPDAIPINLLDITNRHAHTNKKKARFHLAIIAGSARIGQETAQYTYTHQGRKS